MRVVVALGGNALLRRGEPMTAENQRANVRRAAKALAPVAQDHELVISHGNGPQVGLLALQSESGLDAAHFPLDVLGAQTEGMIGYMIEQELGNLLPFEKPFATLLTMVEVDPADPAFRNPSKPIGPALLRGRGGPPRERARVVRRAGRSKVAAGRRVAAAEADLRDPAGQVAPREGDDRHLRGRGRHPDRVRRGRQAPRRRVRHRQGPRRVAARPAPRRRLLHHGDGRLGGVRRLGHAGGEGRPPRVARGDRTIRLRVGLDGAEGRGGARLRRAHGQDGRDRRPRGHPARSSRARRARSSRTASRRSSGLPRASPSSRSSSRAHPRAASRGPGALAARHPLTPRRGRIRY